MPGLTAFPIHWNAARFRSKSGLDSLVLRGKQKRVGKEKARGRSDHLPRARIGSPFLADGMPDFCQVIAKVCIGDHADLQLYDEACICTRMTSKKLSKCSCTQKTGKHGQILGKSRGMNRNLNENCNFCH